VAQREGPEFKPQYRKKKKKKKDKTSKEQKNPFSEMKHCYYLLESACALPLETHLQSILFWLFWRWVVSQTLTWAGLEW
jgi:hypothetical protein